MMDRITVTFLALLALATFAAGQLWIQTRVLTSESATFVAAALAAISVILLPASLIAMGRMLYRTAAPTQGVSCEDKYERTK